MDASAGCAPPNWSRGRRRFIDWVIELDTIRGWGCSAASATSTNARPSSWPCLLGITSSSSSPDLCGCTESAQRLSHGNT
jgi:hypothetical protein